MAVITLAQAKQHLRLPAVLGDGSPSAEEADLQLKVEAAEALVLDYVLQRRSDEGSPSWAATVAAWDETTAPAQVQAAVLMQLAELYRFRGDDPAGVAGTDPQLAAPIARLLNRLRDPALA